MPVITLPDGKKIKFLNETSPFEVAKYINQNLTKYYIAAIINGNLIDFTDAIKHDSNLFFITLKSNEGLKIIRNSCVHLLGRVIKQLWPKSKNVKNFITDKGFYCDLELNYSLTKKDLNLIQKQMHKLIKKKYKIFQEKITWKEAKNKFIDLKETYKVDFFEKNINLLKYFKIYSHEKHLDISKGPQVPNISFCRYFMLKKISIVYYKIDKKNKKLQRIYGTAWSNKEQLNSYLNNLKEIKKRDHRRLGKQLNLYHIQEDAQGMIFWHNDGWIIFQELEKFIREKLKKYNYFEVKGPLMMNKSLWEKTGHLENYSKHMFSVVLKNKEFCIKPMNCPGHVQIFNQGIKSYKDLPFRISEFGSCHRNEPSGSLYGLMRICGFTQDDAHIFCTKDQIRNEVNNCIKMIYDIYSTFGFNKILVKLSTRPKKRIGNNDSWNEAELDLENSLKENNINFEYQPGEGAFYGPKIEFTLFDCLNRAWQCGTIQLDFSLPSRLGAYYIDENNKQVTPIMIHRAILGSIERFIGIITEEFVGFYPTWLSPTQVMIMNITDNQSKYVKNLKEKFISLGIRVKTDLRNEKINLKIRQHTLNRIPYMLICGDKEIKENNISIRTFHGKKINNVNIDIFIKKLQHEIYNRNLNQLEV